MTSVDFALTRVVHITFTFLSPYSTLRCSDASLLSLLRANSNLR